jgi:hypothetical protein
MTYRRPPFTGIHETLPRAGEGAPNEGGGDIPPFGEDIINKIVDVNFGGGGGGVFVSGDVCCFVRYLNVEGVTLEQDWGGLGAFAFGDLGIIWSASYALIDGVPTFLIGGVTEDDVALIIASYDGLEWYDAFRSEEYNSVYNLVWSEEERAFFGDVSGGPNLCITSADGFTWKIHYSYFWDHVTGPTSEPDGIAGYDPVNDLVIYPNEVNDRQSFMYANCTAFADGLWMAGGYMLFDPDDPLNPDESATATSIDGGVTWVLVSSGAIGMHADYGVEVMVAAPASHMAG